MQTADTHRFLRHNSHRAAVFDNLAFGFLPGGQFYAVDAQVYVAAFVHVPAGERPVFAHVALTL
jgi:hypothetical protein